MNKRTAAVIGCGKAVEGKEGFAIGHAHGDGYVSCGLDVELYAVDPDADNLRAFAEKFEVPEQRRFASTAALYEAVVPEVVSICTWPHLHHDQVLEAADRGVQGIICEKPLAMDGSQVRAMVRRCSGKGARLCVAHQRAYQPVFEQLRQLLHDGAIGDQWVAEMRVGDGWDMLSWSVHWIDMVSWLFDAQPTSVLAGIDHQSNRRYRHAVEDNSIVLAEYPGGRQAIFVTGPDVPAKRAVSIRGRDGMLAMDDWKVCLWNRDGYREIQPDKTGLHGFAGLIADLFNVLAQGGATRVDASRSALSTQTAWAAHESARTMQRIAMPPAFAYAPLELAQHPPRRHRDYGRVVLLADAHHIDPETGIGPREPLGEAIAAIGARQVDIIPADERQLTPADLQEADLLVVYHTERGADEGARAAITDWVSAGRPLIVCHCGIGAYPEWQQWRQWMGRHWVWGDEAPLQPSGHPHEPCLLRVLDADRFDPGWDEAWLPRDEVYVKLHDAAPVRELVSGQMPDGSVEPIAWQTVNQPNVVTWAAGHRPDLWHLQVMRDGLRATIDAALAGDG